VLRQADERNAQIAQARARVDASAAAETVATHSHLPNCLRPENYRRTTAEAKLWQQRADLARVRSEVLQDAGNTYVDWLTALRGEAVAHALEEKDQEMLTKARALAKEGGGARALVEGIETSLTGRRQAAARLHQQAEAAAAKLAYLIHQSGEVAISGDILEPADPVDAAPAVEVLIARALENGPGVQELAALEAVLQKALADARLAQRLCSATGCASICGRLQEGEARLREVQLARQDLAGKLELGVREARSAIHSGREQITLGVDQIAHAVKGYNQSRANQREAEERELPRAIDAVLQSIRGLQAAHGGYIQAVSAYNKAQVRLAVLLGVAGAGAKPAP
jgi:outer membrane protein TolC